MSREEALTKLLALGPMNYGELRDACGWPGGELDAVLDRLYQAGRVTWINRDRQRHYMAGCPTRRGRTWK